MAITEIHNTVDNASNEAKKYRQALTVELLKMDGKIDDLAAQLKQASTEAQVQYQTQIQKLEEQRQNIETRLDELQSSGGSALETIQSGLETMWQDFVTTYEQVAADFNKKDC